MRFHPDKCPLPAASEVSLMVYRHRACGPCQPASKLPRTPSDGSQAFNHVAAAHSLLASDPKADSAMPDALSPDEMPGQLGAGSWLQVS